MVCHVVLFRPRADLSEAERLGLGASLDRALREIPSIRRFHVGRRLRHGTGYEQRMTEDLAYAVLIEFDDLAGLQAYLAHPAHQDLGARFNASLASAAIYDYAFTDAGGIAALVDESGGDAG